MTIMINPTLMSIRTKKLGVLIRSARLTCGKSLKDCATAVGITVRNLRAYEMGESSPSLPELELLAYYLQIPLEYFWGNELLSDNGQPHVEDVQQLAQLRQRMIGTVMRKTRLEAEFSLEDLAERTGLSVELLNTYELGEEAVPFPELEVLSKALNISIDAFEDKNGPVGSWFHQQQMTKDFLAMPEDLQHFVSKPINQPYLEVAKRLSEMEADRLRNVAEVLLDITL